MPTADLLNLVALMASILAGFAFSVVVQLAMARDRSPTQPPIRAVFGAFLLCTVALVLAVVVGLLLLLPRPNRPPGSDATLIRLLLVGLWFGAITFGLGLIGLGWLHSRPFGRLSTLAGVLFLLVLHVAIYAATGGLPR
jgi:hypothetical protein